MLPPGSKFYELKDGNEVLMYILKGYKHFSGEINSTYYKWDLLNTDGKTPSKVDYIVNGNTIIKDPNDTELWRYNKQQNNAQQEKKRQEYINRKIKEASLAANAHGKYSEHWKDHKFAAEGDDWHKI